MHSKTNVRIDKALPVRQSRIIFCISDDLSTLSGSASPKALFSEVRIFRMGNHSRDS
jgi:hypothetical protein